jgi:YbbR domain-containing protein
MELLRKNFELKVLAVALALVGWAYLRFTGNSLLGAGPLEQQLSIPILAVNLPLGYVAHFTDREAVVTVVSKRGAPAVKPDEIKAALDLSGKGAGIYNVPVQLVAPDLAVRSLSPASVTLTIERFESRGLPITVHYVGAPSAGIVVNAPQVRPNVATVRAPTSSLAQVAAVRVDVMLPNEPKNIDEMIRPVAVDAAGNEVRGIEVAPDLVHVKIRFVAGGAK